MSEVEYGSPEWLRAEAKRYMPGGPHERGFLAVAEEIERLRNCVKWAAETLPCTEHERELLRAAVAEHPSTAATEFDAMAGDSHASESGTGPPPTGRSPSIHLSSLEAIIVELAKVDPRRFVDVAPLVDAARRATAELSTPTTENDEVERLREFTAAHNAAVQRFDRARATLAGSATSTGDDDE